MSIAPSAATEPASPDLRCHRLCRCLISAASLLTVVCCLTAGPALLSRSWALHHGHSSSSSSRTDEQQQQQAWSWPTKLVANLLGYASVLAAIYGTNRWCRRGGEQPPASGGGKDDEAESGDADKASAEEPAGLASLAGCFLGLQAAYLTWGVLQERVMTARYGGEKFTDAQFLVCANRLLGGLLAAAACLLAPSDGGSFSLRLLGGVPLLDFAYCSVTNVLSAWCQYEALAYVSFPTQVLAKAGKIVPVMLMGLLVLRNSYKWHQFVTAALISAGTSIFLLSSSSSSRANRRSSGSVSSGSPGDLVSGCALLSGYLLFDAFTSTWQNRLFSFRSRSRRPSPLQMMAATGLLSAGLTATAQLQQGSLAASLAFARRHPTFVGHAAVLSACSAVGQLLIFYTIKRFGAVTFAVIMTIRQGFAILLSCLLFGHPLGPGSWAGLVLVFGALALRIRLGGWRQQQQRPPSDVASKDQTLVA